MVQQHAEHAARSKHAARSSSRTKEAGERCSRGRRAEKWKINNASRREDTKSLDGQSVAFDVNYLALIYYFMCLFVLVERVT